MRGDLPFCNFKYCKFEVDGNCTAGVRRRDTCDFRITENALEIVKDKIERFEDIFAEEIITIDERRKMNKALAKAEGTQNE